jgi:hypothetical protein
MLISVLSLFLLAFVCIYHKKVQFVVVGEGWYVVGMFWGRSGFSIFALQN